MKILDHTLEGARFLRSPNTGGALVNPTLIVLHYTASGGTGEDDARFFQKPGQTSAHFVVDRDGTVTQCVPLNVKAWHAGKSAWKGRANCNDFSIGIEIDNWGILTQRADGSFQTYTNKLIPADKVVHAKNKLGNDGYWESYTEAQLKAVADLCQAICDAYPSINEVVGHEDIAPGRKTDPGPALPMSRFASIPGGRKDFATVQKTVGASALNVRSGPGAGHEKLGTLIGGTRVTVLQDVGDWSQIKASTGLIGWVADSYLQ